MFTPSLSHYLNSVLFMDFIFHNIFIWYALKQCFMFISHCYVSAVWGLHIVPEAAGVCWSDQDPCNEFHMGKALVHAPLLGGGLLDALYSPWFLGCHHRFGLAQRDPHRRGVIKPFSKFPGFPWTLYCNIIRKRDRVGGSYTCCGISKQCRYSAVFPRSVFQ